MNSPKFNFQKIVTLTLIILLIAAFSTVSFSPVVYADGGIIIPPPSGTDTTIVTSIGDEPVVSEESTTEAVSFSPWDTIVTAVNALI